MFVTTFLDEKNVRIVWQRGENMQKEQSDLELWRKVQLGNCIKAVMIFVGIILMQFAAYLICVPLYMGLQTAKGLPVSGTPDMIMKSMLDSESGMVILISMISAILNLIWCGVLYYKSDWRERPFSYKKAFNAKNSFGIVGVGFGGCTVLTLCLSVIMLIIPDAFASYMDIMQNIDYENGILTILYVLVLGPVAEEVIFRGAINDRLQLAFPFWIANAIQAALFGVYHMNIIQGLYAFVLGSILGLIIRVTGSIWSSIITHIIFNSTSYLLGIISGDTTEGAVGLLIVFILGIGSFIFGFKHYLNTFAEESAIEK